MKKFLPLALLVLASCGSKSPKFKNPVIVNADNTPLRANTTLDSEVLVLADKGDTLEFDGMAGPDLCRVKPDAHYSRFPHDSKAGYVLTKYITLRTNSQANYDSAHTLIKEKPEHLSR
jgi:hypothetical protein